MARSHSHHRPVLALCCSLALGGVARAQFRASIQGTVTDPAGAAIPGATLTLTDTENNHATVAVANASGVFNFNALPPDHFSLSVKANGFQQKLLQALTVNPDQANAVNVQLDVENATTTVEVQGDATPALDTETASINGNVDSNQIQHLAASGRDVFQLAQLAPGVFGDGSQTATGNSNLPGSQGPGGSGRGNGIFQTENVPQANANGGQNETNSVQVDGISTVSAVYGGSSVITPSEDSVGNVKVIANDYDAEQGRFSGAQIQVTSKTGTNQFHGSGFFRASRPGLNAYQRYNGANTFNAGSPAARGLLRDENRLNQFGGSVGGPILHNRLFAFFAYETQRNQSNQTGTGWYDTAAFRALAPTGSIASTLLSFPGSAVSSSSIIDQTCSNIGLQEGVNCRSITGQGLNLGSPLNQPRGTQDLGFVSSTNPGVGSGLTNTPDIALYNTVNPTSQTASQYNGRVDTDITQKDHVAFAIYWVPLSKTDYNGTVRAYNFFIHTQTNDAYSLIYNHVFSSSLFNEARVNDAGFRWNELTSNPQEPFGLPQDNIDGIGNITLNYFGATGPSVLNQHTYNFKDVATKVSGNHTVKFGGEVVRLQYLNNNVGAAHPNYNFYNIFDFLNDAPHAESAVFNPATGQPFVNRQDNREDIYGFFVQDAWKVKANVTLNVGLRYSYFGPLSAKQNNLATVQFGTGAATYTGLNVRVGGNQTVPQKGNVSPEFGFAYSPAFLKGKAVLRGGFGLNYNQTEIALSANEFGNSPSTLNATYNNSSIAGGVATIDPRISYSVASSPNSLFGYPANPNAVGGFNSANLPIAGGTSLTAYQGNQPTIYTEHFSLDTELDLGHRQVGTVAYEGGLRRHISIQTLPYAVAAVNGTPFNPLVQNINAFYNTGHSNSNALLVGIKHQLSHGIQFDGEFTWQKIMDTDSGPYEFDPYPERPDLAYGRADFNFGKAFKLSALWQPVFFHNSSLLSKLVDGFSFSGIYNVHNGYPFTPQVPVVGGNAYYASSPYNLLRPTAFLGGTGHNTSNTAFENGRPNINFPLSSPTTPYFVQPVVAAGGIAPLPGVSRNSFNGPGYQDLDLTVAKAFGLPKARVLGEGGQIEIRADAFNMFNEINLNPSTLVTNVQDTNFGQATGGLSGRTVNLQARFSF